MTAACPSPSSRMLRVLSRRPFDQTDRNARGIALAPILCAEVFAVQVHLIACQKHEAAQMRQPLDNLIQTLHQPTAEALALVFWEDVHVGEICEGDIIGHHSHKPDLSWTALACLCELGLIQGHRMKLTSNLRGGSRKHIECQA